MNVPVVGTEVQLCRRRSADVFINFRCIALLPTLREVVPNVPLLRNGMQLKTRVRGNTRQGVAICDRRIDRDAVYKLKMDALGRLWTRFNDNSEFDHFCKEQGEPLLAG